MQQQPILNLLISPATILSLHPERDVYVFPTNVVGNKVRGLNATAAIMVLHPEREYVPRSGAFQDLYAIRVNKTPQKNDISESVQSDISTFLHFANEHPKNLFIMANGGWGAKYGKYPFDVHEFVRHAAAIGNIAVPEKMFYHTEDPYVLRRMPSIYDGKNNTF